MSLPSIPESPSSGEDNITKAKSIIEKIRYITIATASKKAIPWCSPVYSAYDGEYNFFWASAQKAQHSENIAENKEVSFVIYNSTAPEGTGKGVYFKAKACMLKETEEIKHGLKVLGKRVKKPPKPPDQFQGDKLRRIYKAVPEEVWINGIEDKNDESIDIRIGIDLLNKP